jgi:hypothetical protein
MKKKIGSITVDAGICWIGDPCYILHKDNPPKSIGKDWDDFVDILYDGRFDGVDGSKEFFHDGCDSGPGLGVVVQTGYGDGVYPVYAELNDKGRVKRVYVDFFYEEDKEDS